MRTRWTEKGDRSRESPNKEMLGHTGSDGQGERALPRPPQLVPPRNLVFPLLCSFQPFPSLGLLGSSKWGALGWMLQASPEPSQGVCVCVCVYMYVPGMWCVSPCMHQHMYVQPQCWWGRGLGWGGSRVFCPTVLVSGWQRRPRKWLLTVQSPCPVFEEVPTPPQAALRACRGDGQGIALGPRGSSVPLEGLRTAKGGASHTRPLGGS